MDKDDGADDRADEPRAPLNLWAGVERRAPQARPGPQPPIGPPPPPTAPGPHAAPRSAPGRPHQHQAKPGEAPRRQARRTPLSKRRKLAVVGVGVALLTAAIALPQLLGPQDERQPARPTVAPRPAGTETAAAPPGLVLTEDRSGAMRLPAALEGRAERVTDAQPGWSVEADAVTDLWWQAWTDESPWNPEDDIPVAATRIVPTLVTPGASHEANLSGMAIIVLSAVGPQAEQSSRHLLVVLDASSGDVAWTRPLNSWSENGCQIVGRGAHVVCPDEVKELPEQTVPTDLPAPGFVVLDTATGEEITQIVVTECLPSQFLQADERLFWAGMVPSRDVACLGGGRVPFAEIPALALEPDALTMTRTGPLLRTSYASVLLTPDGWKGYTGWVEPGPEGVVVREVAGEPVPGQEHPPVTTVVSSDDGTMLFSVAGPAWRRLDLMPDSTPDSRFADLVGAGTSAYDRDGVRMLDLRGPSGTVLVPPSGTPATVAAPDGVWVSQSIGHDSGADSVRWRYDDLFSARPGSQAEGTPATALADTTIVERISHEATIADDLNVMRYTAWNGAIHDADGNHVAFSASTPFGISQYVDPDASELVIEEGPSRAISAFGPQRAAVPVGRTLVTVTGLGIVGAQ